MFCRYDKIIKLDSEITLKSHLNSDFFNINYNEFIKTYGSDDTDFTLRLQMSGLDKKFFWLQIVMDF